MTASTEKPQTETENSNINKDTFFVMADTGHRRTIKIMVLFGSSIQKKWSASEQGAILHIKQI